METTGASMSEDMKKRIKGNLRFVNNYREYSL